MIDVSPELTAFLKEEYDRCRDETLEDERTTAIDRYNGEPYGDEEAGSSQVVARDTAETVDYMVISILRTLVSGDRVVEFVHRDADAAHQATETIMHLLMDEQDGYQILHDWLKAGLLEKNAVAMAYPEDRQPKRKQLEGVTPAELMAAQAQGMQITEAEEAGTVQTDEGELPLFNATVIQDRGPKFCVAAVPNEEFYCSPDARSISEAALKGRKLRKTPSDLVKEGLSKEDAEHLPLASLTDNTLSNSRDENRNAAWSRTKTVWWHEEYARFDLNGDGIDELLYIKRSADFKIFALEEVEDEDDHPFEDWCPFPMQHRRIGQSVFDKTGDLERINTVLLRQSLNGIYQANNPSTYVHEDAIGDNTIEDLLTVRPGRIVRWKGAVAPVERSGNFDPSSGFEMLEYIERKRESRTGITRLNMGLDEKTLNDTAQGQAQLIAKGEQVEEYIARNFANAFAKLIVKLARLLQRHGKPIMVPIDGEYVEVDPSKWPEDMIARSRVGLGASRKEQRLAYRREVIGMQASALEAGLDIVDDQKFYNSAKGFIADAGLGDPTEFFNEPPSDEQGNPLPKQPKPDPEMVKVQGEQQMQAMKLQGEQQAAAAKMQLQEQEAALKLRLQSQDAAEQAQLARDKAAAEMALAEQKMAFEQRMAVQQREFEEEQARRDADRADRESEATLSKNRAGGDLDK